MTSSADVSLVVEKVRKGFETGNQCHAIASGKSVAEWHDIFNAASQALAMPVVTVQPLQGGSLQDTVQHMANLTEAFQKTARKPALVVVDSTGNHLQTDPDINWRVANYTEKLTKKFPDAVFIQVVPEMNMGMPLALYCNNPKIPRDPSKPMYPL